LRQADWRKKALTFSLITETALRGIVMNIGKDESRQATI
jgi:hypothetical protein